MDKDVWHTMKATIGVKPLRDSKGRITGVSGVRIWKDRPKYLDKDVRLLRIEVKIPESFFGFEAIAKGKIESKLTEEFAALMEELE